jgi:dolichyl-phosphate-mannose-protein mannosyltransferase
MNWLDKSKRALPGVLVALACAATILALHTIAWAATVTSDAPDGRFVGYIAGLAITLVVGYSLYLCLRPLLDRPDSGLPQALLILFVIFVFKESVLPLLPGFGIDVGSYQAWGGQMAAVGPARMYAPGYFLDYPPGYLYALWLVAATGHAFGVSGEAFRQLTESPALVADFLLALAMFAYLRRTMSLAVAYAGMLMIALNPAMIFESVVWGQSDSVSALLMFLCVTSVLDEEFELGWALGAIGVLVKPQVLLFLPVLGLWTLIRGNFDQWWRSALAMVAMGVITAAPFQIAHEWDWLLNLYESTAGYYHETSVNAFNLMALIFGLRGQDATTLLGVSCYTLGMTLLAGVYVFVAWVLWRNASTRNFFYCTFLVVFGSFMVAPRMHERYMYPGLAFLIPIALEDPLMLVVFGVTTLTLLFNLAYIKRVLESSKIFLDGRDTLAMLVSGVNLVALGLAASYGLRPVPIEEADYEEDEFAEPDDEAADYAEPALDNGNAAYDRAVQEAPPEPEHVRDESIDEELTADWQAMLPGRDAVQVGGHNPSHEPLGHAHLHDPADGSRSDGGDERAMHADHGHALAGSSAGHAQAVRARSGNERAGRGRIAHPLGADGARPEVGLQALITRLRVASSAAMVRRPAADPAAGAALSWIRADTIIITVLIACAAATRLWHLGFPNEIVFDEVHFVENQARHYLHGESFLDPHPPLDKLIIALGIALFGDHPWSWRIGNATLGIALVGITYLLGRRMFHSRLAATLAAAFVLCDGVFIVDSRIAVIDICYITFAALAYLMLFRFLESTDRLDRRRTLVGMAVALGLCMGSKLYIPEIIFLVVIGFLAYALWNPGGARTRKRYDPQRYRRVGGAMLLTGSISAAVYIAVFLPHFLLGWWGGVADLVHYYSDVIWYESSVASATHPYSSPWWSWPLMLRPVAYWQNFPNTGKVATVWFGGNPASWWGGFTAIAIVASQIFERRRSTWRYFVLIGYLSYLGIWVWIGRTLFLYHYMGSIYLAYLALGAVLADCWNDGAQPWEHLALLLTLAPVFILALGPTWGILGFLVLAGGYVATLLQRPLYAGKFTCAAFCAVTLAMFFYFYPVWVGMQIERSGYYARMWLQAGGLRSWI